MKGAACYHCNHCDLELNLLQHAFRKLGSALVRETGAVSVHFNAAYEPWRVASDERVLRVLRAEGLASVEIICVMRRDHR